MTCIRRQSHLRAQFDAACLTACGLLLVMALLVACVRLTMTPLPMPMDEPLPVILNVEPCAPVRTRPRDDARVLDCIPPRELVLVWRAGQGDAFSTYYFVNYRGLLGWTRLAHPSWTGVP